MKDKEANLSAHLDDNIGITASDVANGEINASLEADSEQPQQTLHRTMCGAVGMPMSG